MGGGGSKRGKEEKAKLKETLKIVAVGDAKVGKTCLLQAHHEQETPFSDDYIPTVFDNYQNTAGSEDYHRLRFLAYQDVDVFLICFSVVNHESYDGVRERWIPELIKHSSKTRVVLVGCQIDLRDDKKTLKELEENDLFPLDRSEGDRLAQATGAITYVECSASTREGIKNVFGEVVAASMVERPIIEVGELRPSGLSVKRAKQ